MKITLNKEQRLFILNYGNSFSCLGFEVCRTRAEKLRAELERFNLSAIQLMKAPKVGTLRYYKYYRALVAIAEERYKQTGWRSQSELNPKLIGLEGARIECKLYGEITRFIVGKSTGFIPAHLEIKRRDSSGGVAISSDPNDIADIKVISANARN